VSGDRFIADFAVDFLEPIDDADALGMLGQITIREVIGDGGNGIALKGFQPELNCLVAAKVMAPHLATSAAARRRFAREAQATAAIVHPSVMPILSVNSEGRLPYLVMPYVDCESLQQRIDRLGTLPVIDILRIGVQVAPGLAAAHAQGLVHRDVKPASILLEKGGDRVMLTDFGLARAADDASLTRSGVIAGPPQYMSPEQARGDGIDARSDLFSLDSVLYALSTGRPPFRAETSHGMLRRVTDDEPRSIRELNPDIPDWLETLVLRLQNKLPDDRFESADQVAELVEKCVAHVQQPVANPLPPELRGVDGHQTYATPLMMHSQCAAVVVVRLAAVTFWPKSRAVNSLTRYWRQYEVEVEDLALLLEEAKLVVETASHLHAAAKQRSDMGIGDYDGTLKAKTAAKRAENRLHQLKQIAEDLPQYNPDQYRDELKKQQASCRCSAEGISVGSYESETTWRWWNW